MTSKFLAGLTGLIFSTAIATTLQAKPLIVYFSLTGNTQGIAEAIHQKVGGDIFRLEAAEPYPDDYKTQTEIAKKELAEGADRAIKAMPENLAQYDMVFVGSPVWWGTMATPVRTFLRQADLSGKKVIPFVTHGGGGTDESFADTAKLAKGATVEMNGWSSFRGHKVGLNSWIDKVTK